MGRNCIITNCRSAQDGHPKISYFLFPKTEPERHKWIAFVKRLGVDQDEVDARAGPCLCIHHFTPNAFKVIGSPSILKKGAVPTIPALITADNARFETLFLREPPTEDIDAKLKAELLETLGFFTSKNKLWNCMEIDDGVYLYKFAVDPLRIVAALKFVGSSVQMQYDGVTLSKRFVEKVLGKIFPLTIEGLPELIQYFEILNIEEFRNQRPDVGFNFEANVRNKSLEPDTCRICFQPAKRPLSDGTRKLFRDITNQELMPNISLPDKCCLGCTRLIETTKHSKDFLVSCSDLLIKYAKTSEMSVKEEEEEVQAEVNEDSEDESKLIPKVELEAEYLDEDFLVDDAEYLSEDHNTSKRQIEQGEEADEKEFQPPRKKQNRKDWLKEDGYSCTETENGKVYACTICEKVFPTVKTLKSHLTYTTIHKKDPSYSCERCGMQFMSPGGLRKHIRATHDDEMQTCKICGKQFNDFNLKLHMKTHETPKHVCQYCGKAFRENFLLKEHIQAVHLKEPFQCQDCEKLFESKVQLNAHSKSEHSKLLCPKCGESFINNQGLSCHLRVCDDKVANKSATIARKRIMQAFPCRYCSRKFSVRRKLDDHEAKHQNNELIYPCDECDWSFARKDTLTTHQLGIHKGVRYRCDYCEQKFEHNKAKFDHMRLEHTKQLCHVCKFCDKRFLKPNLVKRHIDLKHRHKRYRCTFCADKGVIKETVDLPLFLHHMKKAHLDLYQNYDGDVREMIVMDEIEDQEEVEEENCE